VESWELDDAGTIMLALMNIDAGIVEVGENVKAIRSLLEEDDDGEEEEELPEP
jgi:hypothetical protein